MQGLDTKTRTQFFEKTINDRYRIGDAYQAATRVVFALNRVDGTSYGISEVESDSRQKAFEPHTGVLMDFGGWTDIWRHASMDVAEDIALSYYLEGEPLSEDLDYTDLRLIEKLEAMVERGSESIEDAHGEARETAIECIEENKGTIERLADALLQRGSLTGEEIHEIVGQ